MSKGMVKYATAIPRESIVDVSGEVHVPEAPVAGCTCSKVSIQIKAMTVTAQCGATWPLLRLACLQVELKVRSIRCVSRADNLPFELADAMRSEEELAREDAQFATVTQDTRLENRWIDLRTPVNQAIFRIQSAVCQVGCQQGQCTHESMISPKVYQAGRMLGSCTPDINGSCQRVMLRLERLLA